MIELLELSQWELAIIVFVSQTLFLWLRTLNVVYTSRIQVIPAILSGIGIGTLFLIAITIGVNSLTEMKPIPIIAHLLGGAVGTALGLKNEIKKKKDAKNGM